MTLVYRRTRKYMPADEHELALALADGVTFAELAAPVKQAEESDSNSTRSNMCSDCSSYFYSGRNRNLIFP